MATPHDVAEENAVPSAAGLFVRGRMVFIRIPLPTTFGR